MCALTCSLFYKLICQPLSADVIYTSRFQISCISVVTILLMLMHEGCCTIKCGSMTCWNYDGTCDGGRILVIIIIIMIIIIIIIRLIPDTLMAASKSEVAWRTSPEDVGEIGESKT